MLRGNTERMTKKSVFTPDYKRFLALLRAARKAKQLSQEKLAERLGQRQAFVSKVELGERRLDVVELRQLCHAMRIDFIEFVTRLDEELEKPEGDPPS